MLLHIQISHFKLFKLENSFHCAQMASPQPRRLRARNKFGDNAYEQFICEAYGCKPLEISVMKLSTADIHRIKKEIREQNKEHDKEHDKKPSFMPCENSKKSYKEYAPIDNVFKPPVPLPVQSFVIGSINHECKFCKKFCHEFPIIFGHGFHVTYFLNITIIMTNLFMIFSHVFSVHEHQIRIRTEHSYSASPFAIPTIMPCMIP